MANVALYWSGVMKTSSPLAHAKSMRDLRQRKQIVGSRTRKPVQMKARV